MEYSLKSDGEDSVAEPVVKKRDYNSPNSRLNEIKSLLNINQRNEKARPSYSGQSVITRKIFNQKGNLDNLSSKRRRMKVSLSSVTHKTKIKGFKKLVEKDIQEPQNPKPFHPVPPAVNRIRSKTLP